MLDETRCFLFVIECLAACSLAHVFSRTFVHGWTFRDALCAPIDPQKAAAYRAAQQAEDDEDAGRPPERALYAQSAPVIVVGVRVS